MSTSPLSHSAPHVLSLLVAGSAALALAGCGPSSSATPAGTTPTAGPSGAPGTGQGTPRQRPGASGLVAAVDGTTMQVQSATDQTAVTWTGKTTITTQQETSASALAVGDCVSARPAATPGSTGTPSPGAPAANGTTPTNVDAATVTILSSGGMGCTDLAGGFGGGFGGSRGTGDGARPSGAPSSAPSGAPGDRAGGGRGVAGFGVVGQVTAVGSGTFTVAAMSGQGQRGSTAPTPSATPSTHTVAVTFTASTTFSKDAPGTTADVVVGECVRATGTADDTGAVTATSLALSPAVDGACTGVRGG